MHSLLKKLIILFSFSLSILNAFDIKEGYKLALENDMDYKVSKNSLKNIEYDQDIANSLLYPKLDFSAKVESKKLTQNDKTPGDGPHTKSDEYELKLTQPIFDGFEASSEKQLQKNRFKSAIYFIKEAKSKVALDYSRAYISTLREKDLLSLSKESLQISEDIFNKVYKKVDLGYGTKLEFEQVKGNYAENKVKLDIQRINLKESIENLKLYVQTDFDTSELSKPKFYAELPANINDAVELAFEGNPTINVSKANVEVAVSEERRTNKEFYPDVNFVSSYKLNNAFYSEANEDYNEYSLGFELNYNLFNGGKDSAENKKALQNIKDKKLLVKKSQYQVKNRLRIAWNNYRLYKEKQKSLEQYLLVKKDILDATLKEFDLGLKDLNTLLETHVEYIDVKKDLIRNSYELLTSNYVILDSLGSLSEVLEGTIPSLKKIDSSDIVKKIETQTLYSYKPKKLNEKKIVSNQELIKRKVSINDSSFSKIETNEENSSFKMRFLTASKDKYTINLALSNSKVSAQKFLDKYNLNDNAFFFSFRKVNPLQKIMMGVYDTKKEAKEVLSKLPISLKKNRPTIEKVTLKQKLYNKYHSDFDLSKPIVITKKELKKTPLIKKVAFQAPLVKEEKKNKPLKYYSFKDRFLNAPKNKYTINLAYSDSKRKAQALLDNYGLSDDGFYFQFRNEKPLQRIVYGVFDSKNEALKALEDLDKRLKVNRPVVEKVTIKQRVYFKYNEYTKPVLGSI